MEGKVYYMPPLMSPALTADLEWEFLRLWAKGYYMRIPVHQVLPSLDGLTFQVTISPLPKQQFLPDRRI